MSLLGRKRFLPKSDFCLSCRIVNNAAIASVVAVSLLVTAL